MVRDIPKVKPHELKMALGVALSAKCPFYNALSEREREIVTIMDLLHPLPKDGPRFEEVMDVSEA